jgi:hypothetical protein
VHVGDSNKYKNCGTADRRLLDSKQDEIDLFGKFTGAKIDEVALASLRRPRLGINEERD